MDTPTARDRILAEAIRCFGTQGYAGTSVRDVAQGAGVSPALVLHHFGSKEGLRRACDEHVVTVMREVKTEGATTMPWLEVVARARDTSEVQPLVTYLLRAFRDHPDGTAELFDRMVAETETFLAAGVAAGRIAPSSEPRLQALAVVAMGMGPLLLSDHVGRLLGTDGYDERAQQLLTVPMLEMFTPGLITDPELLRLAKEML